MNIEFDPQTLYRGVILVAAVEALAWAVIALLGRMAQRGAWWMLAANLMLALAAFAAAQRDTWPGYVSFQGAALCFVGGIALYWAGALRLLGEGVPWREIAAIVAGTSLALMVLPPRVEGLAMIQLLASVAIFLILVRFAMSLRRPLRDHFTRAQGLFVLVPLWVVAALTLLARGGTVAIHIGAGKPLPDMLGAVHLLVSLVVLFWINGTMQGLLLGLVVRRIRDLSQRDYVTGVLNRAAIGERLAGEAEHQRRHQRGFALAAFELINAGAINDRYGQEAGDLALRELATRIDAATEATDAVGRIGGAQFLVVMAEADGAQAEALVTRCQAALRVPCVFEEHTIDLEPACIWVVGGDGQSPDELLRAVGQALAGIGTERGG